jgi:hypothetical protein
MAFESNLMCWCTTFGHGVDQYVPCGLCARATGIEAR